MSGKAILSVDSQTQKEKARIRFDRTTSAPPSTSQRMSLVSERSRMNFMSRSMRSLVRSDDGNAQGINDGQMMHDRRRAYFRGDDVLMTSLFPAEFWERHQELTTVVKRLSSIAVITEVDRHKYELELQNYQTLKPEEVPLVFKSSATSGLNEVLAQNRLKENGPNIVETTRPVPWWVKLLLCFFNGFAPLLWVACFLVFLSWRPFGSPPTNVYNLALAIVLIIVIVVSGLFTFVQELQATRILAGFLELIPQQCYAIRDGTPRNMQVADLVVGDLVIIEQGCRVPADIRLIAASQIKVDKSTLTGESEPIAAISEAEKSPDASFLTAANICFVGCTVVEGHGRGIVIATGASTQLAKIAEQAAKGGRHSRVTTLQSEINRFVGIIAFFALLTGIAVVLTWAFWLRIQHPTFMSVSTMLANAISVIVAFVPEGLPLALSMGLNIIARRLCGAHFVLVKRLGTIETVGSMSMLASDKTGTLTENRMSIVNVLGGTHLSFTSDNFAAALDAEDPLLNKKATAITVAATARSAPKLLSPILLPSEDYTGVETKEQNSSYSHMPLSKNKPHHHHHGTKKQGGGGDGDEVEVITALELPWLHAVLVTSVLCNEAHMEAKKSTSEEEDGGRDSKTKSAMSDPSAATKTITTRAVVKPSSLPSPFASPFTGTTTAAAHTAPPAGTVKQQHGFDDDEGGIDIEGILSDIESKECQQQQQQGMSITNQQSDHDATNEVVAVGSNSTDRVILAWANSMLTEHTERAKIHMRRRAAELLRLQKEKRSASVSPSTINNMNNNKMVSPCINIDGDGGEDSSSVEDLTPTTTAAAAAAGGGNGDNANTPPPYLPAAANRGTGLWADTDEELSELLYTLGYPSPDYQRRLATRAERAAAAAREIMASVSTTGTDTGTGSGKGTGSCSSVKQRQLRGGGTAAAGAAAGGGENIAGRVSAATGSSSVIFPSDSRVGAVANDGPKSTFSTVVDEHAMLLGGLNQQPPSQPPAEADVITARSIGDTKSGSGGPSSVHPPANNQRSVGPWFLPVSSYGDDATPQSAPLSPTGGESSLFQTIPLSDSRRHQSGAMAIYRSSPRPILHTGSCDSVPSTTSCNNNSMLFRSTGGTLSSIDSIKAAFTVVATIPFSSSTKTAYTYVRRNCDGAIFVLAKGAPEFLLKQCSHCYAEMPGMAASSSSGSFRDTSPSSASSLSPPRMVGYRTAGGGGGSGGAMYTTEATTITNKTAAMNPLQIGNHGRTRMTETASSLINEAIAMECQRGQRVVALAISGPHWIGTDSYGKDVYLSALDLANKPSSPMNNRFSFPETVTMSPTTGSSPLQKSVSPAGMAAQKARTGHPHDDDSSEEKVERDTNATSGRASAFKTVVHPHGKGKKAAAVTKGAAAADTATTTTPATTSTFNTKVIPEGGFSLTCCLSISDPPRKGVREAVLALRKAGIVIAMVTGDSPATGLAIAKQVGIVGSSNEDGAAPGQAGKPPAGKRSFAVVAQDMKNKQKLVGGTTAASISAAAVLSPLSEESKSSESVVAGDGGGGTVVKTSRSKGSEGEQGEWVSSRNRGSLGSSRIGEENTSPLHSTPTDSQSSGGRSTGGDISDVDLSTGASTLPTDARKLSQSQLQQQQQRWSPMQRSRPPRTTDAEPVLMNDVGSGSGLMTTTGGQSVPPQLNPQSCSNYALAGVDVLSSPKYASLFVPAKNRCTANLEVNQYSGSQGGAGGAVARVSIPPRARAGSHQESLRGYAAVHKNLVLRPLSRCIPSTGSRSASPAATAAPTAAVAPPGSTAADEQQQGVGDIETGDGSATLHQQQQQQQQQQEAVGTGTKPFKGFFNMSRPASQSASKATSSGLFTLSALASGFSSQSGDPSASLEMHELPTGTSGLPTSGGPPVSQAMGGDRSAGSRNGGGKGATGRYFGEGGGRSYHDSDEDGGGGEGSIDDDDDEEWQEEHDDDETEGYLSDANYLREIVDDEDDMDDLENSGHFGSRHSHRSRRGASGHGFRRGGGWGSSGGVGTTKKAAVVIKPENSAVLVEGNDLALITDAGWDFVFAHTEMVFARTTPEQKLQIVKESQRRGHRVGVTGDGVNDAPALKRADVGIAMNSGSDAAKDVASIVLLNSNFSAIVPAVSEGRLIFSNLRKVIGYQISAGGWSELLPVLSTFFLGMPQPLSSFLMIIISCLTDVYAGVALMNEAPEEDILSSPPRDIHRSHLVDWKVILYSYFFYANMICVGAFYNYFDYMSTRGSRSSLPSPVPADDDPYITPSATGVRSFPAGYSPKQILFAWNWGAHPTSALGMDERAAMNVASSVFFVTVVLGQMGHLMSIRCKRPYFVNFFRRVFGCNSSARTEGGACADGLSPHISSKGLAGAPKRGSTDSIDTATTGSIGPFARVDRGYTSELEPEPEPELLLKEGRDALQSNSSGTMKNKEGDVLSDDGTRKPVAICSFLLSKIKWTILCAWLCSVATALLVTEVPFFQQFCGTGAVPWRYWLMGIGWSAAWFAIAEVRKWLVFLFPNSIVGKIAW